MPYAEIPGRRLHYVRRGTGEPLLLIMGWEEPVRSAELIRELALSLKQP